MAGSNKWFIYTTDTGADYALKLDESNTEEVNSSSQDFLNDATVIYALPRNVKPRYAVYENAAGTRQIKCVALTTTIYNAVPSAKLTIVDPIDSGTLTLVRIRPETITLPFGKDTGLQDGDAT